jgi:hypothetical protein
MYAAVEADASSLTRRLAGTFEPTPDLYEAAAYAGELNERPARDARDARARLTVTPS